MPLALRLSAGLGLVAEAKEVLMQLTIHTDRGTFTGKRHENPPEDQMETLKDLLQQCAADGTHFTMDTESGYAVIGKDLLRTAVFVVEA